MASAVLMSVLVAMATLICSGFCQILKCPYAECVCRSTVIDCTYKDLQVIPALVSGHSTLFTHLDFRGNNISVVGDGQIPEKLDTIDFTGNPIINITESAFMGVPNLHTLKFQKPAFTVLPAALNALRNLQVFQLSDVSMTRWDTPILDHIGKTVTDLTLANVNIRGFPTFLSNFFNLHKVDLHGNTGLGNVASSALAPWGTKITDLNLSHTGQSGAQSLQFLTKLRNLDLSRNTLSSYSDISYQLIQSRKTIKTINLSGNSFTNMPRFGELEVLTNLNMASNKLQYSNVDPLPLSITHLSFENNAFTAIPDCVKDLSNLLEFNIESNKVAKIEANDFPSNVNTLALGNNPIEEIHDRAFEPVPKLEYLSLGFTKLTRLPLALASLVDLKDLWLPGNDKMECTCDELDLADWFENNPAIHVVGHCNGVDIREYFSVAHNLCASS